MESISMLPSPSSVVFVRKNFAERRKTGMLTPKFDNSS